MYFLYYILLFMFIIFILQLLGATLRYFWPVLLILLIYMIYKSYKANKQRNEYHSSNYYDGETRYDKYTGQPTNENRRNSADVFDADYEVKEEEEHK